MRLTVQVPVSGGRLGTSIDGDRRPVIHPAVGKIGENVHAGWVGNYIAVTIELDETLLRAELDRRSPIF